MQNNNKGWYSIIIAIFVVWFLLVLTTSILKLVLVELNDNRWRYNYLKAFYAAEWAWELAMLNIKEYWYWYYKKVDLASSNWESNMLSLDWNFKGARDPLISYDLNSKVKIYTWNLPALSYDVIPLFFNEKSNSWRLLDFDLSVSLGNPSNIAWNIISASWWLAGTWLLNSFSIWTLKNLNASSDFEINTNENMQNFLNNNLWSFSYLVLFNSSDTVPIEYTLDWKGHYFSKPRTEISVTGKMLNYKQNFNIKYDNTDYLWILKYSIYSN